MRIFFTRHGQVFSASYYEGDAQRPVGNTALSELGKEQAKLVGKRLKELNFNGVIFASPYDRTCETAQIIAEELNARFSPLACLQEMFVERIPPKTFNGFTAEQIVNKYSRAEIVYPLAYPWWQNKTDDLAEVIERVKTGLAPILPALDKDKDVLLVGHAATAVALRHLFGITNNLLGFHWNCHLSLLYSTEHETPYACDSEHIPKEKWTGNALRYVEMNTRMEQNEATMYAFKQKHPKNLVLHIGDTHSANYMDVARMIAFVKPSVIIHTGDLVDEIKAGRIESVRPYWKTAMPKIIEIMKSSGARVIVVPGNNDLVKELENVDGIEVVAPKTVMEFGGKRVYLAHSVLSIDENSDAEIYLYGHGQTGETRTKDDNVRGVKKYFNVCWGVSLHSFEDDEHIIL